MSKNLCEGPHIFTERGSIGLKSALSIADVPVAALAC